MKTILSALLWFVKSMKDGKSLYGKFHYFLLLLISEKIFIYKNLKRTTHFKCALLYLTQNEVLKRLKNVLSLFFYILIKMREILPLVERIGCWIEFYIQLESTTT